jgi:hypothetical protein
MPPSLPKSPASEEQEARRPARPAERGLPALRVRFYRRMKRQRVYNAVVTWDSEFAYRGPDQNVVVRLIAPGAQVVPAEAKLDPNDAADKAMFHVTPLAKGWLTGQKLEVTVNGKKVQEMVLPSKVVSHRATWICFLLMFLGPWFMHEVVGGPTIDVYAATTANRFIADNVPETPEFIQENLEFVHTGLLDLRAMVADAWEVLHYMVWEEPVPFYVGAAFFVLTIVFLVLRADRRKTRVGKPLFLPKTSDE